ncbi:MAG: hypothetical protein CVU38_11025 [Chloroflexi bacterium HGW-Chloroflexi-1]|nr:MAG: hypothetical protein CVU38_11025 [Chloroflexi bacterium HGW-Chloroflexi-1]
MLRGAVGRQGNKGTGRQGNKGTGRQGNKGTGRQGNKGTRRQGCPRCHPVTVSPCHPLTLSPRHPVARRVPGRCALRVRVGEAVLRRAGAGQHRQLSMDTVCRVVSAASRAPRGQISGRRAGRVVSGAASLR